MEISRTGTIMEVAADFAKLERLRNINLSLGKYLAETNESIATLAVEKDSLEKALGDNALKIEEATGRIDKAMFALYSVAPVATSEQVEQKKRGRRPKGEAAQPEPGDERPVAESQEQTETAGAAVSAEVEQTQQEQHTLYGTGDTPLTDDPPEEAAAPAADQPQEISAYQPLDEPIGDCELCMGYGVVEGELNGESTLVPCTCDAGIKVKGGEVASPCDTCSIATPDCDSCRLPDDNAAPTVEGVPAAAPAKCAHPLESAVDTPRADSSGRWDKICGVCRYAMCEIPAPKAEQPAAAPAELPKCVNSSCTAVGKDAKDTCLRVDTLERDGRLCDSFIPVDECKHPTDRRSTLKDGRSFCVLCQAVVEEEQDAQASELTPLQQRCTHPKIFRMETEGGTYCKACKLTLSGQPMLLAS